MKIQLTFDELRKYVKEHFGQDLGMEQLSDRELCITYEKKVLMGTVKVPVNLQIDEVGEDSLLLSYKGKLGVDLLISGVLAVLKKLNPELSEALIPMDGHKVKLELSNLKSAEAMVTALALENIVVIKTGIEILARFK